MHKAVCGRTSVSPAATTTRDALAAANKTQCGHKRDATGRGACHPNTERAAREGRVSGSAEDLTA